MAYYPASDVKRGGEDRSEEGLPDMQALLGEGRLSLHSFRRGDVVEGTVVGLSRDGLLVDVGGKSEGIVPPHEMHTLRPEEAQHLQAGDKVLAWVVQPETPEGQLLLSLDRARGERGWRTLQERLDQNESFEAEVVGCNKGGLLVDVEGLQAFAPLSQIMSVRAERGEPEKIEASLSTLVGKKLRVKVLELNRRRNRIILSERAAMQEWRSQQKERLLGELKEGDVRKGCITSIRDFGIFVDLGGADGLAHLSEISWDRSKPPEEMFHVGDEVEVYVMKVDPESKRIALSLRRAQTNRWQDIIDQYHVGQVVIGQVTKLADFGAFARIDDSVEGLIHISELADHRIAHPREVVEEGDTLPLKIVRIEKDRHRLGLSLRQARDEAEGMGYVFDSAGIVVGRPVEWSALQDKSDAAAEPPVQVEAEAAAQSQEEAAESLAALRWPDP